MVLRSAWDGRRGCVPGALQRKPQDTPPVVQAEGDGLLPTVREETAEFPVGAGIGRHVPVADAPQAIAGPQTRVVSRRMGHDRAQIGAAFGSAPNVKPYMTPRATWLT